MSAPNRPRQLDIAHIFSSLSSYPITSRKHTSLVLSNYPTTLHLPPIDLVPALTSSLIASSDVSATVDSVLFVQPSLIDYLIKDSRYLSTESDNVKTMIKQLFGVGETCQPGAPLPLSVPYLFWYDETLASEIAVQIAGLTSRTRYKRFSPQSKHDILARTASLQKEIGWGTVGGDHVDTSLALPAVAMDIGGSGYNEQEPLEDVANAAQIDNDEIEYGRERVSDASHRSPLKATSTSLEVNDENEDTSLRFEPHMEDFVFDDAPLSPPSHQADPPVQPPPTESTLAPMTATLLSTADLPACIRCEERSISCQYPDIPSHKRAKRPACFACKKAGTLCTPCAIRHRPNLMEAESLLAGVLEKVASESQKEELEGAIKKLKALRRLNRNVLGREIRSRLTLHEQRVDEAVNEADDE